MLLKKEVMYSHIPYTHNTCTSVDVDMRVRQISGPFEIVRDYHGLLRHVGRLTQIVTWGVQNGRSSILHCLVLNRRRGTSGGCWFSICIYDQN